MSQQDLPARATRFRAIIRAGIVAAGAVAVLWRAGIATPSVAALAGTLRAAASGGLTPDALVAQAAGTLAWGCVTWLGVGALVVSLSSAPGLIGSANRRLAHVLVPGVLRRGLQIALGVTVVTCGPALAATHPAGSARHHWPALDRPAATSGAGAYLVRPGDCLWSIATDRLRAQTGRRPTNRAISATWPHWYAANRTVIGADPGVISPGQRLLPPHL